MDINGMRKVCSSCVNYSPRFRSDVEGTCNLGGVFVAGGHVCDRWELNKSSDSFFHVTQGSVGSVSLVDQGSVADFGE